MTSVVAFPEGPLDDERIERVSAAADADDDLAGYVVLIHASGGISFKFAVPECPGKLDQMIGALVRVQRRLIQHQEDERG